MVTQMPPGIAGLFLAALFGAAMSMLASDLNCLAVIITEDFYAHFRPRATDRRRLRVGKLSVALCGILAILVAIKLSASQGSALSLYYLFTSVVAGGLAGLFLLAFLIQRIARGQALIAIAVNLAFTAWATVTMNHGRILDLGRWNYPWHEDTIGAAGNTLMFVVGWIASIVAPGGSTAGPTLWDWLRMRDQPLHATLPGEPEHEPVAQSR